MPLRAMPRVGRAVTVKFLDFQVRGTVVLVEDEGRRLQVSTVDGETLTFALNQATATFTAAGDQTGARLSFDREDHG